MKRAIAALLFAFSWLALAQSQPAEAKLERNSAELKLGPGESRCGDYLIFHKGSANYSGVDKVSYFFVVDIPRFAMAPLERVEVVVNEQPTPTVQQFSEDGKLVRVVLRLSQAERDKASCLAQAKAGKASTAAPSGF